MSKELRWWRERYCEFRLEIVIDLRRVKKMVKLMVALMEKQKEKMKEIH